MKNWKEWGRTLLRPPLYVTVLASLSFPALIWVFLKGLESRWFAYPVYVLSAYALTVDLIRLVPLGRRWLLTRKQETAREDGRTPEQKLQGLHRELWKDMGVNLGFGVFYLISGSLEGSVWLVVNGVYNLIQGLAYGVLIPWQRTLEKHYDPRKAWGAYILMGWWLMAVNLTMTGCVYLVIWQGETESYSGIMVFAVAALTFYKLIASIADLVKYRHSGSPVLGAACNAGHTEAIMSLFMLQTALLSAFGQDFSHTRLMNTLTGAGVCLLTIAGAGLMVLHGRRKQKGFAEKYGNERQL